MKDINKNSTHIFEYKIYTDVSLNGDDNSPQVNYSQMTITNHKDALVYKNTFVTNHAITQENIHAIARMGRNRWKIENEVFIENKRIQSGA